MTLIRKLPARVPHALHRGATGAAAAPCPRTRQGKPVSIGCVLRWVLQGAKDPNGKTTTHEYDERDFERSTTSADFGRINRNTVAQSNFQRFVQLGFRLTF